MAPVTEPNSKGTRDENRVPFKGGGLQTLNERRWIDITMSLKEAHEGLEVLRLFYLRNSAFQSFFAWVRGHVLIGFGSKRPGNTSAADRSRAPKNTNVLTCKKFDVMKKWTIRGWPWEHDYIQSFRAMEVWGDSKHMLELLVISDEQLPTFFWYLILALQNL